MNSTLEPELLSKGRRASAEYHEVFGEMPDMEFSTIAGEDALVVSGWLWLYRSCGERWSVRISIPRDPWFLKFECFLRLDGFDIEKPSFDDALVYLFQHETHRRCHAAREGLVCRR
jgi:hypothetical protein